MKNYSRTRFSQEVHGHGRYWCGKTRVGQCTMHRRVSSLHLSESCRHYMRCRDKNDQCASCRSSGAIRSPTGGVSSRRCVRACVHACLPTWRASCSGHRRKEHNRSNAVVLHEGGPLWLCACLSRNIVHRWSAMCRWIRQRV
ncbi:unnamed protein product [Victoria cruziana]